MWEFIKKYGIVVSILVLVVGMGAFEFISRVYVPFRGRAISMVHDVKLTSGEVTVRTRTGSRIVATCRNTALLLPGYGVSGECRTSFFLTEAKCNIERYWVP
jgi:hypothetical protein